MTALTRDVAEAWMARWDRQQEGYMPEREERFTALIDAVELFVAKPDPLILDLGCGPGSLAARLLDRVPGATVVAIDTDPLLMTLGRAAYGERKGLEFADLDLRSPGWAASLGLDRPVDAAVSTTALHWLSDDELGVAYGELAGAMRPGALFLNGDHMSVADQAPALGKLEVDLRAHATRRRFGGDLPEDWAQWWEAVAADPHLGPLKTERDDVAAAHDSNESYLLSSHVNALRTTGFTEITTLWQRGDDRLLAATRA
ncbi:class I SAM-dependent methyltransferase [Spirillospora sp. CA-294931]|uniref:class I SAM-dependent methyltransferase n=1 Tax=Spirillospora sp. CA-294931 TaxID=3240042 RepID=UPI003D8A0066